MCHECFEGPGSLTIQLGCWLGVVEDAAGAGHVDMVLHCLVTPSRKYSDSSSVDAAAREGRMNVIEALEQKGYSCTKRMRDQAAKAMSAEEERDGPLIYYFRGLMCVWLVASGRDDFCISCFLKWVKHGIVCVLTLACLCVGTWLKVNTRVFSAGASSA